MALLLYRMRMASPFCWKPDSIAATEITFEGWNEVVRTKAPSAHREICAVRNNRAGDLGAREGGDGESQRLREDE